MAADGFALQNLILVVAGTLVGTSGALLTKMMSDAMGRSLPNIILGGLTTAGSTEVVGGPAPGRSVRSADATDIGALLAFSRRVLIVPGYGLAVAQAQHTVVELAKALEANGVEVAYAIHPVAGPDAGSHERPAGRGRRAVRESRRPRRRQRQVLLPPTWPSSSGPTTWSTRPPGTIRAAPCSGCPS